MNKLITLALALILLSIQPATANSVNVYSARSEALIKPLLDQFTEETGISVKLITGKADLLISRMTREGKYSPADVLVTTDVGRLHRASQGGLLQAMDTKNIESSVPANFRDTQAHWTALTMRARPIMYIADRVNTETLTSIFDLSDTQWQSRVCIRSSSNIYNQSMVAAMIEVHGESKVQTWANKFVTNFARSPKGGDRDQIKAMVAGECDVAIANTYYLAGMAADKNSDNAKIANQVKVFWPDQATEGAHVNISGAGIAKHSKNKKAAQALIEYMLTPKSQQWYAKQNQEYPIVKGAKWSDTLSNYGEFKAQSIALEKVGERNAQAVKLMDKAGWK